MSEGNGNKNKKRILSGVFLILGFFVFSHIAGAATGINKQINFQGKVVNSDGTNVTNGSYDFVFKLYDVSSGGTAIWTETWNSGTSQVTVTDGVFQVNLGTHTSLPGSVDFNTDNIYLGVTFHTDSEMTPRIRFTAVPYAFNADKVHGLTVTDTTGTLTVPNGKTISFADAFSTSGAFPLTLTATASTTATLPSGTITLADTTTGQTLTNKTIGSTGLTFSGAATDITTASGEDLVIVAAGAGVVDIQDALTADSLTIDTGGITISAGALAVNSDSITSDGALTIDANARVAIATGDFLSTSVAGVTGAAAGDIWYDSTAGKYKINEGGTTKTLCNTTDAGCGAGGSGMSIGGTITSATQGSILFAGASGVLAQDNTNFFWDDTNNRLGIGNNAPDTILDITSSAGANTQLTIGNTNASSYDAQIGFEFTEDTNIWTIGVDDSDNDFFKISGSALGSGDRLVVNTAGIEVNSANDNVYDTQITVSNLGASDYDPRIGFELSDGSNTWTIGVDDSDADKFKFSGAALGTNDRLTILTTGFVGVGLGNNAPDTILDITSSDAVATQLTIGNTNASSYDAQIGFELTEDTNIWTIGVDDSDNDFFKISGSALGSGDRLVVNTAGIEVNSSNDNSNNTQITVSNLGGGDYDPQVGFELSDGSNTWTIGVDDSDADKFKFSGAALGTNDRLTILTTGFVGVGLGNNAPDTILDITSSDAVATQLTIGNTNASSYDAQIGFELTEDTNIWTIGVDDSDNDRFKISTTGLGVGDALSIGTSDIRIGTGGSSSPKLFGLDIKNDSSSDPTGFEGAIYYNDSSNKFRCYQNSGWTDCIGAGGGMSIGGTITSATEGSVLFAGASGVLAQDNTNFFWDNATKRFGIGDNTPDAKFDIDTTQTSGTILGIGAPSATTLSGSLVGANLDLSTNYTATSQNVTGMAVTLPNVSTVFSWNVYTGISVSQGSLVDDLSTMVFRGLYVTNPSVTYSDASGVEVSTGTISSGTQQGVKISAQGVSAGTLYGVSISGITAGSGTETAINIGSGWDTILNTTTIDITGAGAITGATGVSTTTVTASGVIAANGGITFDNNTDTVGSFTSNGTILMNSNIFQDIGNTGTDFIASTGALTLAGVLTANSGVSIAADQSYTGAGAITLSSGGSSGLTIDSASGVTTIATGDYLALSRSGVSGAAAGYIWYDSSDNKFKINENGTTKTLCNTTDAGCGSAGVNWDAIGDAAAAGAIAMNEYAQTLDWNTASTAGSFDGLTVTITNDASTDSATQRAFVVANQDDSASTGTTETIMQVVNRDSNETVGSGLVVENTGAGTMTNAIQILETAGTITTAIAIGDNVTTGISIGTGVTTGISIASGGITGTGNFVFTNTGAGVSLQVNDEGSDTTPFVVDASGNVGIGTSSPSRILDIVQAASAPQLRLSKDLTYYSEFTVDSVGDLQMSATGSDIRALSENLWICDNDACPALTLTGDGNIFVENVLKFGNGVYLKNDSATELGVYDNDDNAMLVFDEI